MRKTEPSVHVVNIRHIFKMVFYGHYIGILASGHGLSPFLDITTGSVFLSNSQTQIALQTAVCVHKVTVPGCA